MEMQDAFTVHENSPPWVELSKEWISACYLQVTGDQDGPWNYVMFIVCRLFPASTLYNRNPDNFTVHS